MTWIGRFFPTVSFPLCRWYLWCSCWAIPSTALWKVFRFCSRKSGCPLATSSASGATWVRAARAVALHPSSCSSSTVCTRWELTSGVFLHLCYVTSLFFSTWLSIFVPCPWAHHIPQKRTDEGEEKARIPAACIYTFGLALHFTFQVLDVWLQQCVASGGCCPDGSLILTEWSVLACFSIPSQFRACTELHVKDCCLEESFGCAQDFRLGMGGG